MDKKTVNASLKKIFSRKLSMLRQNSGQTIEAAADSLDMAVGEYFRFLKGQRLPQLATLLRINQKYAVSLDWWFNELEDLPRTKGRLKQRIFELQALSTLKKFKPEVQPAMLAMLKTLAKKL
ncbi:MAG: helix-turn-helix domain-containing protein [Candidatus Margulisbacteria bacterium]|jgi:transcriptional regulator with XRE-family HTH domain|nr:helix-turn-helix domain-containing protein [Candidatus Margulisiibacteriota bacterium]